MKTIQKISALVATTGLCFFLSSFTVNDCPVITYNGQVEGTITVDDFKQTKELSFAKQIGFSNNKAAKRNCELVSFTLYYIREGMDPVEIMGKQQSFHGVVLKAIHQAQEGDRYTFVDMQAKCDGNTKTQKVNPISLKIK